MVENVCQDPDVYRIFVPLPDNPLKNLNSYVIMASGSCLVIDTGFNRPECAAALWAGLEELHIDFGRATLFLTHLHGDHSGLAEGFADKGVPIYMNGIDHEHLDRFLRGVSWPAAEKRFLSEGFSETEMARQSGGNQAKMFSPRSLFPVTEVGDGDRIPLGPWTFRCIHTPGHTPGHTCLYLEERRILFSGDHILFDITPNISVWNGVPHSLADYLASLEKLKPLPVAGTFPGHRQWAGDTHERIDELIEHHHLRLQEVLDAVNGQPGMTAYEIAGRITWSARGKPWEEFSPNQRWFAMGETLSHLVWLEDAGCIVADGSRRYLSTGKTPGR